MYTFKPLHKTQSQTNHRVSDTTQHYRQNSNGETLLTQKEEASTRQKASPKVY